MDIIIIIMIGITAILWLNNYYSNIINDLLAQKNNLENQIKMLEDEITRLENKKG